MEEVRLGTLTNRKIGYGIVQPGASVPHGIPVIKVNNIISGLRNVRDLDTTSIGNDKKYSRTKLKGGELIVSVVGTIGRTAIVPMNFAGCNLVRATALIDIPDVQMSKWVKYYIDSPKGQNYIRENLNTTVQPTLNVKSLVEMPIPVYSTQYMQKAIEILGNIDDKIEVNRRINDNLEQQAQALFKSWFVEFEPFRDLPFVESELGMIPEGWSATVLEELCSFISRGLTPKYDDSSDELILGQTCVRNNIVTLDNARKHKPKQKTEKWVQLWDTLINSTGVGSLGRVGIVYFDMNNVAIDSHITVARAKSALLRHYVGRNLLGRQFEIENMAVGSTGQTELPKDRVKSLPIVLPDDNALTSFNAIIEPIAYQLYRNIEESRRLAELRDTLLPRLMSGEIKVEDVTL